MTSPKSQGDSRPPTDGYGLAGCAAARAAGRAAAGFAALLALIPAGCSPGSPLDQSPAPAVPLAAGEAAGPLLLDGAELLPTPAPAGAQAPELSRVGGAPALTWLEQTGDGPGDWRLRFARWTGGAAGAPESGDPGRWTEPVTVAPEAGEEQAFFANWADRPGVVEGGAAAAPEGRPGPAPARPLYAWWLAKVGSGIYAYGVHLARSADGGETWRPLGLLHDDRSATEHGFVTLIPEGEGVRAFWLDGRATARGEPMTLRTVRITDRVLRDTEELLDPAVCDCCNTAAVEAAGGPVVAYRDRSAGELRDIALVRREGDGWSEPAALHRDGWKIAACPVNGPALARLGPATAPLDPVGGRDGGTLWAAWFTAAGGAPRVLAAVSADGGRSFGQPVTVDGEGALGRLDLAADPTGGGAVVSWLDASVDGGAAIRLRRLGPDGRAGQAVALAPAGSGRASGVPRLLAYPSAAGTRLLVAWVEPAEGSRAGAIRLATLPAAAVPAR